MVMRVHAPDSRKDLEEFEKFMDELTKILRDGRKNRATHFFIAGDFNIELGLLCTGDETDEELGELYGPF